MTHYRFNDLRKGFIYEYRNFSDPGRLIRKYANSDTTVFIYGGWNFKSVQNWEYNGTPEPLADTVIDSISYKKVRLSRDLPDLPDPVICYIRCDKTGTIFNIDSLISKIAGCPLVKVYTFSSIKKGLTALSEVNFLADSLTPEEQKVFDAWEKYADQ